MSRNDKLDVFLMPGEYHVGTAACQIRTLLGSCVSITLWNKEARVGAMSHFLLTARKRNANKGADPRYGEDALELMLAELKQHGIEGSSCEARIFGGATMFPSLNDCGIGRQNGEVAQMLLRRHGIPVRSECLYGEGHRKITFDIASGNVVSDKTESGQKVADYFGRAAEAHAFWSKHKRPVEQFGARAEGVEQPRIVRLVEI